MIISFEHRKINGKSVFTEPVTVVSYIEGDYRSFMVRGYNLCYVNLDKYDENKCFIYYIRNFMRDYKNKIRKEKFKILLDETK